MQMQYDERVNLNHHSSTCSFLFQDDIHDGSTRNSGRKTLQNKEASQSIKNRVRLSPNGRKLWVRICAINE